jgi:AraC-like DNA-binding protein
MWFRGVVAEDCYTLMFVIECPGEGHSFNFHRSHQGQCLGFFAPGETLDAKTPAGYRNAALTIPAKSFQESVAGGICGIPESLLQRGRAFFPEYKVWNNLAGFLESATDVARRTPAALECEEARAALECEAHELFCEVIRSDCPTPNPKLASRYQRMKLVRDFIQENSHRPISLKELCAASGLSRRGLEYLFTDLLDVGIKDFLQRLRLEGVHADLLAAEPRHGEVKHHALNWGFWHLGRFAAAYRALFGENPGATLARRSTRKKS